MENIEMSIAPAPMTSPTPSTNDPDGQPELPQSRQYAHAPQMRDYDAKAMAGVWWTPFVMFHAGFPNVASPTVNTDGLGVRFTVDANGNHVSPETLPRLNLNGGGVNVVVGGSTAFGVGATSDAVTVPSLIARATETCWLNLGMRSWILPQNLIQFLAIRQLFPRLDRIVLLAGLNELDIHMISKVATLPYGPFYGWREFFLRMNAEYRDATGEEYQFPSPLGNMAATMDSSEGGRRIFLQLLDGWLANWSMVGREYRAKVVFCLQPVFAWLNRKSSPEEEEIMAERFEKSPGDRELFEAEHAAYRSWYRDALEAACTRYAIKFIDANPLLEEPHLDGEFLFVDPWHLTDRGSSLVAGLIDEAT